MAEMVLPSQVDAERVILGAVLLENTNFDAIASAMKPHYFSLDSNRRIWDAIVTQMNATGSTDVIRVETVLAARKEVDAIGGKGYLWALTDGIPRRLKLDNYVELVREAWVKRELIKHLSDALEDAVDAGCTGDEVCKRLQGHILDIETQRVGAAATRIDEFLPAEYATIQAERNHVGETIGMPTGVADLDLATTGYREGEMTIIGAWPSRGKTSLMLQGAYTAALAQVPTLIVSLEMRKEELGRRLMSLEGAVPYRKLRDPRELTVTQNQQVLTATDRLMDLPLWICDEGSMDAGQITSLIRVMVRRYGIKIVYVDFIQIVDERGNNKREVVGRISSALRRIAKAERVPVVVASQLSRPDGRTPNVRPTLFNLRESGELEQDAHNVLLLHRPMDVETNHYIGEDEIIIAKQRHGSVGVIPVVYDGQQLIFKTRHSGGK